MDPTDNLIDALRASQIDGLPVAAIPKDFKLESLRTFKPDAERATGTLSVDTISSLADYIKQHELDGTAVFASRKGNILTAVIDWHGGEHEPGWGRHKVSYALGFTPEYLAWTGLAKSPVKQADFAEFLEENLPDVIEPDGAALLEAIRSVSGSRNITFQSAKNVGNGDMQIVWKEETEAAGGTKGDALLPTEIKIKIPIYRGAELATTYEIKAFLRYRINEGRLTFEVKLHRLEKAVDACFDEIVADLRTTLSSLGSDTLSRIYLGQVVTFPDDVL